MFESITEFFDLLSFGEIANCDCIDDENKEGAAKLVGGFIFFWFILRPSIYSWKMQRYFSQGWDNDFWVLPEKLSKEVKNKLDNHRTYIMFIGTVTMFLLWLTEFIFQVLILIFIFNIVYSFVPALTAVGLIYFLVATMTLFMFGDDDKSIGVCDYVHKNLKNYFSNIMQEKILQKELTHFRKPIKNKITEKVEN